VSNGAGDRGGGVGNAGSSPAGGIGNLGGRSAGGSSATESTGGSRTTGSVGGGLTDAPSRTPARSPALAPAAEEELITAPPEAALRPSLPFVLLPQDTRGEPSTNMPVRIVPRLGTVQGSPTVLRALTKRLTSVDTAPPRAVRACRDTIKAAAAPYQAKQVEAVGAGPASRTSQGITTVPIDARVIYARGQVSQVRQARISCRLNNRGIVVALR
jgi:hypothetical protein